MMMAAIALIGKDLREHYVAAFFLSAGSLTVVLLLLAQNNAAAFSMSTFEIIRLALLSFIPLVALIVGNRLIVGEYLSGTRLFVEALPIGQNLPLIIKYISGLGYLLMLAACVVLIAAATASLADEVTPSYILLILSKTWVLVWLYWSVVFCFSLCGYLRIALYLMLVAVVAVLAFYPGIDSDQIPPLALLDDQLFVFERDVIPWSELIGTAVLSLLFTTLGFFLSRVGEGSVVERLAKPMTRRDFVAIGVLAAAGLAVWSAALDRLHRDPVDFSSEFVVRLHDPDVSVLYLESRYENQARIVATRISNSLSLLQAELGLSDLASVKLALDPVRKVHDIDYDILDGVFITANWLPHDSYDDAILDAVVLHGVLSVQTAGRATFEPYHWVLDGFTRWWVEQGTSELIDSHRDELIARSLWVMDNDPLAWDLISRWQLTADRFTYPSAEALAWSVFNYLEQEQGREKVLALASEFLTRRLGTTAVASLLDRRIGSEERLYSVVGQPAEVFFQQWQIWLERQRELKTVGSRLARIPMVRGVVSSAIDADRVHQLSASYEALVASDGSIGGFDELAGRCILKHDYIGPFDTEFEVSDDYADVAVCSTGSDIHTVNGFYSRGDRVFIALDYETEDFHQPLRLHAERLAIE